MLDPGPGFVSFRALGLCDIFISLGTYGGQTAEEQDEAKSVRTHPAIS